MQVSKTLVRATFCAALALALVASCPLFAEVIPEGVDLWATAAGHTHTGFGSDPIPAGFFCENSKPFTGRIIFQGSPLAVEPAGSLGGADTIVHRLDNATFNEKGEAMTRIQLLALSLTSVKPVDTGCGQYNVAARLDGEQPVTDMKITRTATSGGSYVAPLALNVRLTFTPVNGDLKGQRTLTRRVTLGPSSMAVWTYATAPRYSGHVMVDTDGDGKPDTALPMASNFVAGVAPAASGDPVTVAGCTMGSNATTCPPGYCLHQACHCNPNSLTWDPYDKGVGCTYLHCLWVCVRSGAGAAVTKPGGSKDGLVATPVCAEVATQ
ncbi:MAG TPA: hypothetical protein VF173_22215 [Thermoanaerobaculia bacterium]|nr:hypothetical protein [Thermoanaerobaculia bacterium]